MSLDNLLPGLQLAAPRALWWLAALPFWLVLVRGRGRRTGGLTFPIAGLPDLPRSWRVKLLWLPDVLRCVVLACLIAALARPQLGREREKITQQGVDILLALDVSASMLAEDVRPNRIEAAKRTIQRFVQHLTTDRVGLVVFAGRSFTQCPLTTDYGTVLELVSEARINMVGFDGTAIGEALANCVYRFESDAVNQARQAADDPATVDDEAAKALGKARSRVVIFLTDGFNNTGRVAPIDAAHIAKLKNIKVHCIGLGSPQGAPIPYYRNGRRTYLQAPDGSVLLSQLDERTLQDISSITGGRYFLATDAAGLEQVYRQIAAMEKHDIQVQHLTMYEERFLWPLCLGLALLLLELFLRATVLRVVL